MFKLRNPLPQALRDTSELRNFYKEYNLVPYAGSTSASSHSFLRLLTSFYDLSPSHGSCIDDICFWSFDGDVEIVNKARPGLKADRVEVAPDVQERYYDFIESVGIPLMELTALVKRLYVDWKKTGNAYLRYREIEVGGQRMVSVSRIPPSDCMYLSGPGRTLAVSEHFFSSKSFKDHPVELIRVYPEWSRIPNGRETVFHIKNKRDNSEWYGRPDSLHSLFWQYVEWQEGSRTGKIAQSDLTAIGIIFAEKPDPQAMPPEEGDEPSGAKVLANALRAVTTNRGDFDSAESFAVLEYPNGLNAPAFQSVAVNRDSDWFEASLRQATNYIYASHRWSKVLNGYERPNTGIGGNVLIDEFLTRNASTIRPTQRNWEAILFRILRMVNDFAGFAEFDKLGLQFEDKVEGLVEDLGKSSGTKETGNTLRDKLEVYGTGVRAGAFTPQLNDEASLRAEAGLPEIGPEIQTAWEEDKGFRRPVTLKLKTDQPEEQPTDETTGNAN